MFAEVGLPLLGGIFLEVNALVLGLMVVCFFLHEATALWDVSYAVTARDVSPIEQHAHSFLEMIPLMAILLLASMHWGQFLALWGAGPEVARFSLQLKAQPLGLTYFCAMFGSILCSNFSHTWRGGAAGLVDTDLSFLSFLELYGTEIAERRMPARRVVEALDVVEHI